MTRYLGTAIVAIVFFALGAGFQRLYDGRRSAAALPAEPPATSAGTPAAPAIQFDREPVWA